jgi:hypothetical protein
VDDYGDDFEDLPDTLTKKSQKSPLSKTEKQSHSSLSETLSSVVSSELSSNNSHHSSSSSSTSRSSATESVSKSQSKRSSNVKLITPENLKKLGMLLNSPQSLSSSSTSTNAQSDVDALESIPFPTSEQGKRYQK